MLWPSSTTRRRLSTLGRKQRAGSITIWSLLVMVIGLAMMMLVVNWTYLVLVNRHTLRLTDVLATSAVQEMLDEGRLADLPYAQADDVTAAQNLILDPSTGLLKRNNDGAGTSLRPQATGNASTNEVLVTGGRIDQASLPVGVGNPFATAGSPLNTLRVEVLRKKVGNNPVQLLLRGFGSPDAADISAASFASLDSRVTGFRPLNLVNAPVIPLAILQSSWNNGRNIPGVAGRMQLDVLLDPVKNNPPETLNGALVSLNPNANFAEATALTQITNGVTSGDLAGGILGPVYAGSPVLVLDGSRDTPNNAAAMVTELNLIAASNRPIRAFPLYSSFNSNNGNGNGNGNSNDGTADVVGFIAARIVEAALENNGNGNGPPSNPGNSGNGPPGPIGNPGNPGNGNGPGNGFRLRVRLEPAFLVHNTVETGASPVPENVYIHKIRLTR